MIRARRLFIVPVLTTFLIFIPYVGIIFMLLSWFIWYNRNREDVHLYFRGKEYRMNEASKETIKEIQ